jgi:glucokinase
MMRGVILGIEIGGTKLQAGLCDERGRLRQLSRVPVNRRAGRAGILRQLEAIAPPMLAGAQAIGVGFGGPVDSVAGRVVRSFHVSGWDGFALRQWFERKFGAPVVVENDSNCAALGEALCGAGKGKRVVFYTNLGTGIGGGLVIDGKLYSGRYGAMEIGHTRIGSNCRIVESLASGVAIERGVSTLRQAAEHFGVALANVITLLNPDIVVVGGGVPLAGERFFGPLRASVARLVFAPYRKNYRIVPARLGESVVVVGAALLAGAR